ncbi:Uncharacterized protein C0J52_00327 [Blattella germanica]|nr:Uncharacterized protein C0J52_00327 [Blattella germanica]
MAEDNDDYYLELSATPVRFESVSKVTNVFFDDSNKQVFAVRSGGVTGVIVKGPTDQTTTSFRMEDKGPVISIKFSPDQQVLAIQRTKTSVKHTLFHFQVVPEKHSLKALKSHSLSVNWFVFCPHSCLILLSSGTLGNQMLPLHFKPGNIIKLTKFEIELGVVPKPPKLCLLERDVTLATLYGAPSIVVLRHQPRGVTGQGAEVVIYTIQKMLTAKKSHILRLDMSGRFAINVIDNLIVVHHQASKTSMLFDINMDGESDGFVTYHQPVTIPRPIKPFSLRLPVATGTQMLGESAHINCELCILCQRDLMLQVVLLMYVGLRLHPLVNLIQDKCLLVDFLLQRKDSKPVVIQVCGSGKFIVWVLLEYIRSLNDYQIPVQHYLYELVINSLVQHKAYYQLHQLLQYHVVTDSKPLVSMLIYFLKMLE